MSVKLANIVTPYTDWIGKEYNVVDDISKINQYLPTLIVGYEKTLDIQPDIDILEYKYSDDLYWTFTKKEDRNRYVKGLGIFKNEIKKRFIGGIIYTFIDPYELSYSDVKRFIKHIKSGDALVFRPNSRMVYIMKKNRVFGIDTELLTFMNIDKTKLNTKINNIKNSTLLNSEVIIEYKDFSNLFEDDIKYIPYLYSLEHDK